MGHGLKPKDDKDRNSFLEKYDLTSEDLVNIVTALQ